MKVDRLYNCDCIEFMKVMESKSVDFVLTDIPYGECNNKSTEKSIRNMNKGNADLETFRLDEFLPLVKNIVKNQVVIFCGIEQVGTIYDFFRMGCDWPTRQLIWSKTNPPVVNGQSMYLSGVENAVWAKRPGAPFYANCQTNVLSYPIGGGAKNEVIHPTEKNHRLLAQLILDNTKPGDLVFDPCSGSASSLVVAGKLGRHFLGCELRKEFYEPANERLLKTGYLKSLFEE